MSLLLGVNIDHVATLRQARYARMLESPNAEPSPLQAGLDALEGGADSITIHVRGDRRHMQTSDAFLIRAEVGLPLNFEMGVTEEMAAIALKLKPDFACLVPESREEVTTEGGLDVRGRFDGTRMMVARLQDAGIRVSLFIDPDLAQIEAAAETCADMIELHTGAFANAEGAAQDAELERLVTAAKDGKACALQVNAGHGINYSNIGKILTVPHLAELNIGHSIVARAMRYGFITAVKDMKALMANYDL
ncbi:pyridoxine 5'-phosphate synthase [Luteolibacter pohnpeiensis]|uniref:Pyridoxine 5'-phosphate synthase n=1 Tax=Luteolibacter pohnpeiensis TaxID=454153 RepID=A0A934S4L8_9BACT|nr:pyridoxine 5'-phosphate synthase [Luteolibacter pohnpeiensis]MBK1882182.1 pyridoxine 5'-phosphate synthase [Luteolibacter pohnpeiensis]